MAEHGREGHHGGAAMTSEAKATSMSRAATLACPAVLGGGSRRSHGGGGVVLGQGASEGDRDDAEGVEETGEGALVLVPIHTDRGKGEVEVAAMVGQVLLHGDHVAILSNTWRATK